MVVVGVRIERTHERHATAIRSKARTHAPRDPPRPTTKASAAGKRKASWRRQTRRIRKGQWLPRLRLRLPRLLGRAGAAANAMGGARACYFCGGVGSKGSIDHRSCTDGIIRLAE